MAKDNNLTDFLKNIADAIRTAEGLDSSVTIPAQEFSDHIEFLGNYEPLTVTPTNQRQEFTQAGQGYSAFLPVVVSAMPGGTANIRDRTSGGTAIAYGKEVHLSAGYYSSRIYYNSVTAGSATGNAGTLTYKSIAQDTSNKKKFTITSTVSAPAPTISSGYITSGTAGTATDRTVVITLTDAQAQAAVGSGTATGNAGTITYVSHTQDSTNKKKFTVTGTVSAPAPTISAGYISSGTAGTGTNRTVSLTITDAQAQAAVGSAAINAYFDDNNTINTYFNGGTSTDYDVAFTYGDTVVTAGYTSENRRASLFYKIKTGSASASHTLTELSSVSSAVTEVTKQLFSVQGKGTVSTIGWISSVSNGTTTYYKVKDGSATTPTASGAATATLLSGTTLTVSRNVTPTVVAGWVSSGTVGTVTITGTVPTQSKSATPTGTEQTISPDSGKLLSSVTVNPPEIEGLCKYQVYTTENRLVSGNSAISPVNLTISALDSSKTYNIIVMLSGYGWGPTSTAAPNTGAILGLYNVLGNSLPSTVTASKTFNATGFANGSHTAGTFTVSVGVYNSTTIRIATSASGLQNSYPGAAYVDVKMVIIQEVD